MAETFALFLAQRGVVSQELINEALRLQRKTGALLGTSLLELGCIRHGELLQSLAQFLRVPPAPRSQVLNPNPALVKEYSAHKLRSIRAIPYARGPNEIYFAFADPRFQETLKDIESPEPGKRVVPRIALEPDVETSLDQVFGSPQAGASPEAPLSPRAPRVITSSEQGFDLDELAKCLSTPGDQAIEETGQAKSEGFKNDAVSPAPAPSFRNEDEVAFARATGFDREKTAIFRLDDLAARDKADDGSSREEIEPDSKEQPLPPPPDAPLLRDVVDELHLASNEEAIADILLSYFAAYFSRVLLLIQEGDDLCGRIGRGWDLDGPELKEIRAPLSSFSKLFEESVGYYGPPPGGKELESLYEPLGTVGVNSFLLPIDCWCEPVWLLFADHGDDLRRYEDLGDLEVMAKEAALAIGVRRGV